MENYWDQFSIAERNDLDGIQAVFNAIWKTDKEDSDKLANLNRILFRKACQHCVISHHERISEMYQILWEKTLDYGLKHFRDSDLSSFLNSVSS